MGVFAYPESGELKANDIAIMLDEGELEPASSWGKENSKYNIDEDYFIAKGCRFKIVLIPKRGISSKENRRLNYLYQSRDLFIEQLALGELEWGPQ